MVIEEQQIVDTNADCIADFMEKLPNEHLVSAVYCLASHCVSAFFFFFVNFANASSLFQADCPPCEAYSLKNITIFLERLNYLLEEEAWSRQM